MDQKREEQKIIQHFGTGLLHWNETANKRQMPWKGEKDPYKIWLSEVILQQTRVEQGLKYYQNFIIYIHFTVGAYTALVRERESGTVTRCIDLKPLMITTV